MFAPRYTFAALAEELHGELCNVSDASAAAEAGPSISSKQGQQGGLFVAIPGTKADGHDFIDEAFERGAAAAVVTRADKLSGRPGIVVEDTRAAASCLAALYGGRATEKLRVVGVTGTNGKTTIHWLVYHALERLGERALRIGTLGFQAPGISDDASLTTPDPMLLHDYFRRGLAAGARGAAMEASSHALEQRRVDHVQFDAGVFTNLTRDHLDYHGTMEAYYAAKRRLFELIADNSKTAKGAVINTDDEFGRRLHSECGGMGLRCLAYGGGDDADLRIVNFSQSFTGSDFTLRLRGEELPVRSCFIGLHNSQNIAAAIGACAALGYEPSAAISAVCSAPPVPGRLEAVGTPEIGIYVDYAHTPDALVNVLRTLRELVQGKLWVVFGCGGDRDRGKRPQMAKAAETLADHVVVTSDNPRTEDPQHIIDDILSEGAKAEIVEPDRRTAIRRTLEAARAGDVVLIAGKGHEDYQILGTRKHHFSDQEEVRKFFVER